MPPPLFATLANLDELGVSPEALSSIPNRAKRNALLAASGRAAPYLRKRYKLPLQLATDDLDLSGIAGGGSVLAYGAPGRVADVSLSIVVGGNVGASGLTYRATVNGVAGPVLPVPTNGQIIVDGVTLTLSGSFTANDVMAYTTGVDWGVRDAVVSIACYILLHNRGLDPATEQDLKSRFDSAMSWLKDLAKGDDAELEPQDDATPLISEAGPLFTGQTNPWDWLDQSGGGCGGCG